MSVNSGESGEHDRSRLRVVECGSGVSASYATKLLADVGADVIKVESPRGDLTRRAGAVPWRSTRSRDERLVRVPQHEQARDRRRPDDARRPGAPRHAPRRRRCARAQRAARPIGRHAVSTVSSCRRRFPRLVVTSISMFGDHGPRAHWRGYELTASNAGGWAFLSPGASPSPELPPLKPFGAQCDFHAAVYAAFTSLAAYRHQLRTGHRSGG